MISSRDLVRDCLTFQSPARIPRDLWALPGVKTRRLSEYQAVLCEFPPDIAGVSAAYPAALPGIPDDPQPGFYSDPWGSIWQVGEPGVIGEVKQPALSDWSALAHFCPPFERLHLRSMEPVQRFYESSDRFILSEWTANPFERLQFLRGPQNLYIDIAWGTGELRRLAEMVHDYFLADILQWSLTPVDGIVFSDDWGSNQGLLINPRTWRELFKPLYRDYVKLIHAAGKYAFFHSDGNIQTIFDDLVEIGIDAINSQLFVMDIEELGRQYRGRITFWGELDRQRLLPFGTPAQVREAVRRVRQALCSPKGGCIASLEWGLRDPVENIRGAFSAWQEDGAPETTR